MKTCWALTLVLLSGCATSGGASSGATLRRDFLRFDAEEMAFGRWHTVEADTFRLITDLPTEEAKRGAQLIAQSLVAVSAMFGRAPVINQQKIEIVALASDMEFERVFGTKVAGLAFTGDEGTTIFIYGSPDKWFERVRADVESTSSHLQHELAHGVLHRYFPTQPRWFAEGMAEFLETAEWLDDSTVRLGEVNVDAYSAYRKIRSLRVADMLAWKGFGERDLSTAGYYGLSWVFVHWAFDNQLPLLGKYFFLLAKGDPDAAWAQTFAPMADSLDVTLHQWATLGSYTRPASKVPPRELVPVKLAGTSPKDAQSLEAFLAAGVKLK